MEKKTDNSWELLTGSSKGLGLEICKALLYSNRNVISISRSTSQDLDTLKFKFPNSLIHLNLDLFEPKSIDILKDFIKGKSINSYINNAAWAYDDIITNVKIEPLQRMFQVNVFSPIVLTRVVIRESILSKRPISIIHISSISVHTGYKGLSMYAATKGALEAFSKNTAREWGDRNVRSNCIVAGFMETEMSATLSEDQKTRIYQRTAQKKPTSKKTIAETIKFLISEQSISITGQNIFVDSGTI
jgi:3-oxoacyl-[acyl-carrier protein] reductase